MRPAQGWPPLPAAPAGLAVLPIPLPQPCCSPCCAAAPAAPAPSPRRVRPGRAGAERAAAHDAAPLRPPGCAPPDQAAETGGELLWFGWEVAECLVHSSQRPAACPAGIAAASGCCAAACERGCGCSSVAARDTLASLPPPLQVAPRVSPFSFWLLRQCAAGCGAGGRTLAQQQAARAEAEVALGASIDRLFGEAQEQVGAWGWWLGGGNATAVFVVERCKRWQPGMQVQPRWQAGAALRLCPRPQPPTRRTLPPLPLAPPGAVQPAPLGGLAAPAAHAPAGGLLPQIPLRLLPVKKGR